MGPGHATLPVQIDLDLGHRQLERSAFHPPLAQDHGKFVHAAQQIVDLRAELLSPGGRIPEELVDLAIVQPLRAADGRLLQLGSDALSLGREFDQRRLRVTNFLRLKARQTVRDDLRQHRNHPVGQVDAGRSVQCLAVQGRVGLHEMRHVGDVDAQEPMALFQSRERNRVVEVPRVGRVDRHDGLGRQIDSILGYRSVERIGRLARFLEHVLGKLLGQIELANHRKGIDARLSARAEHFGQYAFAFVDRRGESDHLENDLVVDPGVLRAGVADLDRLGEQGAVDLDEAGPVRLEIGADELMRLPLDDLDDLAARARVARPRFAQLHQHHVAGGRVAAPFGRYVDVFRLLGLFRRPGRANEAEALLRSLKGADDPIGFRFDRFSRLDRLDQMVRAKGQLSPADQPLHGPAHIGGLLLR